MNPYLEIEKYTGLSREELDKMLFQLETTYRNNGYAQRRYQVVDAALMLTIIHLTEAVNNLAEQVAVLNGKPSREEEAERIIKENTNAKA